MNPCKDIILYSNYAINCETKNIDTKSRQLDSFSRFTNYVNSKISFLIDKIKSFASFIFSKKSRTPTISSSISHKNIFDIKTVISDLMNEIKGNEPKKLNPIIEKFLKAIGITAFVVSWIAVMTFPATLSYALKTEIEALAFAISAGIMTLTTCFFLEKLTRTDEINWLEISDANKGLKGLGMTNLPSALELHLVSNRKDTYLRYPLSFDLYRETPTKEFFVKKITSQNSEIQKLTTLSLNKYGMTSYSLFNRIEKCFEKYLDPHRIILLFAHHLEYSATKLGFSKAESGFSFDFNLYDGLDDNQEDFSLKTVVKHLDTKIKKLHLKNHPDKGGNRDDYEKYARQRQLLNALFKIYQQENLI